MKKALVVGIDFYQNYPILSGCVNDAQAIGKVLQKNSDGSPNFGVKLILGKEEKNYCEKKELSKQIKNLFEDDSDIALFYFSGHGYIDDAGGYLFTSESSKEDDGIAMTELLEIANNSPAKNKIILLDCCDSDKMRGHDNKVENSIVKEGAIILAASTKNQYSDKKNDSGIFTSLLVDALNGSAANLLGEITPISIYAHIDQSLGPWEQRPIFKYNLRKFIIVRKTPPLIPLPELRLLTELFKRKEEEFTLDPSFEPEGENPSEENTKKFEILQKYNRINLVVPVGERHMYHAAMSSKSCKLTILGQHYWKLVEGGML